MGGTGVAIGGLQLVQLHGGLAGGRQLQWLQHWLMQPIGGTGVGRLGGTGGCTSGGPGGRFVPGQVQACVGSQKSMTSGTHRAQHGQGGRRSPMGGTGVAMGGRMLPIGGTG